MAMQRCPQCGLEFEASALGQVCPKCVVRQAIDTEKDEWEAIEIAGEFAGLEIDRRLGQGGMGVVFKARQPQLQRDVALKILPGKFAEDSNLVARFQREGQALAKLNHPNIVSIYEFGEHRGYRYFVMEYVDGVNLRELMGRGKIPSEEALKVIPQICDALEYAHGQGIVHRDIKPENILLDRTGRVKIADFGLAKLTSEESSGPGVTRSGAVMGTPHYMAPEQVENPRRVDHRADIYSLGVVCYELLTGELPIGRFEPPSRRARVDRRLDEIVLRSLEKEPERRFERASEFRSRIEDIAASPDPQMEIRSPRATRLVHASGLCLLTGFLFVLVGVLFPGRLWAERLAWVGVVLVPVSWILALAALVRIWVSRGCLAGKSSAWTCLVLSTLSLAAAYVVIAPMPAAPAPPQYRQLTSKPGAPSELNYLTFEAEFSDGVLTIPAPIHKEIVRDLGAMWDESNPGIFQRTLRSSAPRVNFDVLMTPGETKFSDADVSIIETRRAKTYSFDFEAELSDVQSERVDNGFRWKLNFDVKIRLLDRGERVYRIEVDAVGRYKANEHPDRVYYVQWRGPRRIK